MNNKIVYPLIIVLMMLSASVQASMAQGAEGYSMTPPYPYILSHPIENLPQGYVTIGTLGMGQDTYYYSDGAFYQKVIRDQVYIVVPPPIGAVVYNIPQGYGLMLIDGILLYEFQGVFYKRILDGFKVVCPPE